MPSESARERNDPGQYDDLAHTWWDPAGGFAMLHWLAASRAGLVPAAPAGGGLLVDIACGGGLFAPHARRLGYTHAGVDLGVGAVAAATAHGVLALRGDAAALPLASGCADVVLCCEVLEHVPDVGVVIAEACRVLRPGGLLLLDTIAATRWGRFTAVTLAERVPGGPPLRLHDPALFVDRRLLVASFAAGGVELSLRGLVPSPLGYARWLLDRTRPVRMLRVPGTAALFSGVGRKAGDS